MARRAEALQDPPDDRDGPEEDRLRPAHPSDPPRRASVREILAGRPGDHQDHGPLGDILQQPPQWGRL
eukprot:7212254-Alexandrium_andersonii.AAC.1